LFGFIALWVVAACGASEPSPACQTKIEAEDATLTQILQVDSERQPWDDSVDALPPLATVDAPLVLRSAYPSLQLTLAADGTLSIREDSRSIGRLSEGPGVYMTLGDEVRRTRSSGTPFPETPVTLFVAPDTPTQEVDALLKVLHGLEVAHVDFVVARKTHPPIPQIPPPAGEEQRLQGKGPPVRELLAACSLTERQQAVFNTLPNSGQAPALRVLAEEALRRCDCAVDPAMYTWAMRLNYVPTQLTNVLPVRLPATLQGERWADTASSGGIR
jgi:hypothetical protein